MLVIVRELEKVTIIFTILKVSIRSPHIRWSFRENISKAYENRKIRQHLKNERGENMRVVSQQDTSAVATASYKIIKQT